MRLSRLTSALSGTLRSGFSAGGAKHSQPNGVPGGLPDPDIRSIHYHSATVVSGGLFFAFKGQTADGHDHIDSAVKKGAAALVVQRPARAAVPVVQVTHVRKAMAEIADTFYGQPSQALFVIGITGTNGKTTTSYLLETMLSLAGLNVGVIGTINYRFDKRTFDNPVTTPESVDLQGILAQMRDVGVSHVVMEVSSHAIALDRIHKCRLDVGVFTNLTQDHLDFHGSMQQYWTCKQRLFTHILKASGKGQPPIAVINTDNAYGRKLAGGLAYECITVGRTGRTTVRPLNVTSDLNGIRGTLTTPLGSIDFRSRLIGGHNLENICCAAGVGLALDLPPQVIARGIDETKTIPGRLERVSNGDGRFIYVDYAHTPDAIQQVLKALSPLKQNRLICIFGCGGDRDREKRPLMGEIVGSLSDVCIVTSDNPRSEDPMQIIEQIVMGVKRVCPQAIRPQALQQASLEKGYVTEVDRRRAIKMGIQTARKGDIVLIAGKGHENYQIVGNRRSAFDDRLIARQAIDASTSPGRALH